VIAAAAAAARRCQRVRADSGRAGSHGRPARAGSSLLLHAAHLGLHGLDLLVRQLQLPHTHTPARTHARTHTHTSTRASTRASTHAHAAARTQQPGVSAVSRGRRRPRAAAAGVCPARLAAAARQAARPGPGTGQGEAGWRRRWGYLRTLPGQPLTGRPCPVRAPVLCWPGLSRHLGPGQGARSGQARGVGGWGGRVREVGQGWAGGQGTSIWATASRYSAWARSSSACSDFWCCALRRHGRHGSGGAAAAAAAAQ
jgi:hypothetical protein